MQLFVRRLLWIPYAVIWSILLTVSFIVGNPSIFILFDLFQWINEGTISTAMGDFYHVYKQILPRFPRK